MQPARKGYDLDLSQFRDEELVVLAKECGYQPAANALILRLLEHANHLILHSARTKLAANDAEDARQNGVLTIMRAISKYDTMQFVRPQGRSFRSFLMLMLTDDFKNFVKHLLRVERHYDRSRNSVRVLEASSPLSKMSDPSLAAERQELKARIDHALRQLSEPERYLWERLACGTSLRVIAADQGMSYITAKRRRKRLLAKLAVLLEGKFV